MKDWLEPRWGIGSVRLHLDLDELAIAVLLFDRMVLPVPDDEEEAERWAERGWDPESLARRLTQLADLVHWVPWDERLRGDWRARFEKARRLGAETEGLAYGLTPQTIALSAWEEVYGHAVSEGRAPLRPVPVAWYPGVREPPDELGVEEIGPARRPLEELDREVALLFRRELDRPLRRDPEEAFDLAVRLAAQDEFVRARRSLFVWEAVMAAREVDPHEAAVELGKAAEEYDEIVREHAGGLTTRHAVHALVPAVAGGIGGGLIPVPGAGMAGGWAARYVTARALPLPAPPDPDAPEAALSVARRRMSTLMS